MAYVIGPTNDIVSVTGENSSTIPADIFNATGLIVTRLQGDKVKYCSGALAAPETPGGNPRVVTNHHCFAQTDERGLSSDLLLVEACTGTEIYLGFAPVTGTAPQRGTCMPGSLRTNATMDLAVFTLSKPLPEGHQPLSIWEGDQSLEGRPAMIVHYPDVEQNLAVPPGQKTKLPMASLTQANCVISGVFGPEEWELDRSLPYGLRHSCDLIHGSSGSPLIDVATKKIVGINWGGIKIKDNGPEKIDNVATRAIFLTQFLSGGATGKGSSGSAAMDAIAAQRNASSTAPKKQSRLPFGCGVVNAFGGSNTLGLLLLLFAPFFGLFASPSARASSLEANSPAAVMSSSQLVKTAFLLEHRAASSGSKSKEIPSPALSFTGKNHKDWQHLEPLYLLPQATCPIDQSEVESFVQGQKRLDLDENTQHQARIDLVKSWSPEKIACLLATLSAVPKSSKSDTASDPLPLVIALQSADPKLTDASSEFGRHLLRIATLRYLDQFNYPEALRSLIQLQDHAPAWRLVYETIQRVYNYRQKGKGAVALNP